MSIKLDIDETLEMTEIPRVDRGQHLLVTKRLGLLQFMEID